MFVTAYAGGATDKSVHLRGFTASTGVPYTAGAHNTSGITAKYRRHGANAEVTITLATQTANGAHSDGGFVHVSGGVYRLDLPDAAIASGSDFVDVWVYGITDVVFDTAHIDILGADPRAGSVAADVVSISGDSTAADNAEAFFDGTGYAGGTIRLGVNAAQVGGQTASAAGTVTFPGTIASTTNITAGTITTVTNLTNAPSAGDFTATMKTSIGTAVAASAVASVTGNVGGNVTGSVGSVVGAVGSVTGAVGSVTAGVTLANNAMTAAAAASDFGTEIANAVLTAAASAPIAANVEQFNTVPVTGNGVSPKFGV